MLGFEGDAVPVHVHRRDPIGRSQGFAHHRPPAADGDHVGRHPAPAGEEAVERALVHQLAATEDAHLVTDLLNIVEDVAGEHHGGPSPEAGDQVEYLAPPRRIESGRRFVEQKQIWFADDGSGQTQTLQHAPRETTHPATGHVGQSGPCKDPVDAFDRNGGIREGAGEIDHLTGGEPRVESGSIGQDADSGR